METFKAWKELIKAVKGISSAIEGEDSKGGSGEVDNTNYFIPLGSNRGFVNKNLDATKVVFSVDEESIESLKPTKVGDIFTQEGVDIINSMLSNEIIKKGSVAAFVFIKDSSEGDLLVPVVQLRFDITNKYQILFNVNYAGYTRDKFTLNTPMSEEGIA